jgi:hypothetical protein
MHHNLSLKTPPKDGVSNEKWCKSCNKKIEIKFKYLIAYKINKQQANNNNLNQRNAFCSTFPKSCKDALQRLDSSSGSPARQ